MHCRKRMSMTFYAKTAVAVVILSLAAWLGFVIQEIPRNVSKGVGASVIVFGVFNLLLFRRHARQIFEWSQPKSTKLLQFWSALGKSGLELLFLGIGFVLLISGIVLCIRGVS